MGSVLRQRSTWKGDTRGEGRRDGRNAATQAGASSGEGGAGRCACGFGVGKGLPGAGLPGDGPEPGGLEKKAAWAAAHRAKQAQPQLTVLGICRRVGMSAQNYYACRQARDRRQV